MKNVTAGIGGWKLANQMYGSEGHGAPLRRRSRDAALKGYLDGSDFLPSSGTSMVGKDECHASPLPHRTGDAVTSARVAVVVAWDSYVKTRRSAVAPPYKQVVCTAAGVKGGPEFATQVYGKERTNGGDISAPPRPSRHLHGWLAPARGGTAIAVLVLSARWRRRCLRSAPRRSP